MTTPSLPRAALAAATMSLFIATSADASLSLINDRAAFESQGTIAYNYGFEDYTGLALYYPGQPWTTHGVTYTSAQNLIVGPTFSTGSATNVLVNNTSAPLTASINGAYNMFAVDLGVLRTTAPLDFQLQTTAGTYLYSGLGVPNVSARPGSSFYGFIASGGESFTGFTISRTVNSSWAAIDNVTLGNARETSESIPEPSTLILLGGALGAIGLARKKAHART